MFKISAEKYELLVETLGNIIEWYSFALFMPFLHILSQDFFPAELNVGYKETLSFLALSVGLFMRPFGAAILGPIGDKFGRRKAISISILLMAIPTVCIGLLPNYKSIGIFAPILLIVFRALQGVSLGGEYTAAMVHLVEKAPSNKRGFYGSLSDAGSQVGVLMAGQALIILCSFFSNDLIYSFAWRIPFICGVLLIPFAFLVPDNVSQNQSKKSEKKEIFNELKNFKKEVLCVASVTSFSAVGFYTLLTFLPYYLVNNKVLSLQDATTCSVYSTLIMTVAIVVGGYLSDLCSKKLFMALGIIGVVFTVCFMFLSNATSFDQWMTLQLTYGAFIGLYYSSRAAFFSSAFPKHVRCTAVSVSFSVAQAIFGGLTPALMNQVTKVSPILSIAPIAVVSVAALYALYVLNEKHE